MLSPRAKRNISRILPFGLIWLMSGLVFLFVEKAALGDLGRPSTGISMNYQIFIFSSLAITAVGLLVGLIELVYLNNAFAKQSFAKKIWYKLLIYGLLLFVIIFITYPIAVSLEEDVSILDRQVWNKLFNYLTSYTNLSTILQLGVALGLSLFYAEISENIGYGILLNFFTGKYHKPVEENRIFMFLDMRSSTTIAEQLGHIKYFQLLKEYYSDLSDAVIEHSGQVYQYVGDEMIISWTFKAGMAHNNCINCFFAMKEDLQKQAGKYEKKYGLLPTFKAGIHFGKVTTGEIGVVKKEIIFTGDVLNATARIQGLCNTFGVDLLLSSDLINELKLGPDYEVRSMGKKELRGKKEEVELYTVSQNETKT